MKASTFALDNLPVIDRKLIYYGLALSLCLHYVAYLVFAESIPHASSSKPQEADKAIRVKLKKHRVKHSASEPAKEIIEEIAVRSIRVKKNGDLTTPVQINNRSSDNPRLRVDKESIRKMLQDSEIAESTTPAYSDNEAVVMNSDLLRKLNLSKRHTGVTSSGGYSESQSNFAGGSWASHVRIDDMCFRVVEADPLDSFSRETWYRVACVN